MAGPVSIVLVLTLQFVTMYCIKWVYRPYGIHMCRQLCTSSPHDFYYLEKDLSCHPSDSVEDSLQSYHVEDKRSSLESTCAFLRGQNVCSRARKAPSIQPQMTTKATHTEVHFNRNISLYQACQEGRLDVVKYILSQGLEEINSRGFRKWTPVMVAARNGHLKVFEYLISHHCDLSVVDDCNNNIFHVACEGGNVDIVRKLSEKCDIESKGRIGRTPIMVSACYGHKKIFELLRCFGCRLTAVDNKGNNILHVACVGGHVDMVRYIVSQNIVSMESRGYNGWTPLLTAALTGQKTLFEFLMKKGCNVTAVSDSKNNILHLACDKGHLNMVKYILSLDVVNKESRGKLGRTPVMIAAVSGQKKVFEIFVKKACRLRVRDDHNNTVLHLSCYFGHTDIVKQVVSLNKISLESRGHYGRTPLMMAVHGGNKDIFDFLKSKDCSLTAVDDKGSNILHAACMKGHVNLVKYLMTHRDVEGMAKVKNKHGRTPVQEAERKGHVAVISLLRG